MSTVASKASVRSSSSTSLGTSRYSDDFDDEFGVPSSKSMTTIADDDLDFSTIGNSSEGICASHLFLFYTII
jgi:hypothetical protein